MATPDSARQFLKIDPDRFDAVLGNRVVYAETLGHGTGVLETRKGVWTGEVSRLVGEVQAALAAR